MPQHDYVLDDANGAAFRADANAVLAAVRTNNSGSTEPSTPYAGQFWLDTSVGTNGKLKMRNQANNAWLDAATMGGVAGIANGGGGGTTAIANIDAWHTKGANVTSATTTNLSTATGIYVHITGSNTITGFTSQTAGIIRFITFDAALTVTYNATSMITTTGADLPVGAGDTGIVISEGSGNWRWLAYNKASNGGWDRLVPWTAVSGGPTFLDFDLSTFTAYRRFRIYLDRVRPAHSDSYPYFRVKIGGTAQSSSGNYSWTNLLWSAGSPVIQTHSITSTLVYLGQGSGGGTTGIGAFSTGGLDCRLEFTPFDTNVRRKFMYSSYFENVAGTDIGMEGRAQYGAATAIDGVRIGWGPSADTFNNIGAYMMEASK